MTTANIAPTKVVPVVTTLTPYDDDFNEDKNFHRILFRPGYSVQGRELTQLQTILQNQIERFGNNIFTNGSLVLGGQIYLDTTAQHINLQPQYANTNIQATSMIGNTVSYATGNAAIRAVVMDARESSGSEPPTLIVKYLTGSEFTNPATSIVSSANTYANTALTNVNGPATLVSINDGIFFINGYFVKVPAQSVVVDKYSNQANARIGLEYTEDIITESNDASLLDPAQESSNYQAPGAARLQINFDLAIRSLDSTDDSSFVELMRVSNGVVLKQVTVPTYSVIGDTMARRTFDESGSYTVRRFNLAIDDHPTDNTKLQVILGPGKAYIKGYEYESIAQQSIDLNKARDTQAVTNRNTTLTVGNYVNVTNVANSFDTNALELVDIHAVVNGAINVTNTTTYNSTKIGTARVGQVKYYGTVNSADANNDVLSLSLFDFRLANLTTNAVSSTSNTVTLFDNSSKFTAVNGAYIGSTVRIISGPSAGEKYTITGWNAGSKIITIGDTWIVGPNASSQLSLDFDFDSANSIVKNTTYTAGAPAFAAANVHISSKNSANGYARLYNTDQITLIYDVGDQWLTPNTASGQTFQYMKYIGSPTPFTSGGVATISLASGETFYAANDTTGQASTTLSGIIPIRLNTGKRMTLSNVAISGSGQTATLQVPGEGATIPFVAYVRVNVNSGAESKPKTKTLRSANTTNILAAGTSLTQNTASGTTTTQVNIVGDGTGQAIITNPSNLANEWMRLYTADVKSISAIYDLNGASVSTGAALSQYNNVTNDFYFDNGQRDTFYDFGHISLKPGAPAKVGPLIVCFNWYDHSAGSSDGFGYFNVDSYIAPEIYANIPSYTATDGTVYNLRDCIDFRPSRTNLTSTSPNYGLGEARIPYDGTGFLQSYSYYLPRKSSVIMTKDLNNPFTVVDGISSKNPIEPPLQTDSMVLYKLTLDPYTAYRTNVSVQFVENKRYTMRDIGNLETRIANLEYYQSLSLLEQATSSMSILDVNGLERTKYGIWADNFSTQAYGDVNNPDYFVSIDTTSDNMRPAQNVVGTQFTVTANTNTIQAGQVVMLQYTEVPAISQPAATKWEEVQPYMLAQWVGAIIMDPPDCNWIETKQTPDVIINTTGVNDAIVANTTPTNPYATKTDTANRWFGLPL